MRGRQAGGSGGRKGGRGGGGGDTHGLGEVPLQADGVGRLVHDGSVAGPVLAVSGHTERSQSLGCVDTTISSLCKKWRLDFKTLYILL